MSTNFLSDDARELLESFRKDFGSDAISSNALMSFASFVQGHSETRSIELQLLIVQVLAQSAAQLGSQDAAAFLESQWPQLKTILPKRWARAGFEP